MKTVIIPDIHNKIHLVEEIAERYPDHGTNFVCLGDYFDDLNDIPEDALRTAMWLRDKMLKSNWTFLAGNHDLHYRHSDEAFRCSGYTPMKSVIINRILSPQHWEQLRVTWWLSPTILLSHAGIDERWGTNIHRVLLDMYMGRNVTPPIFIAANFNDIKPRSEILQIVGYTPDHYPRLKPGILCLDTGLHDYAVYDSVTEILTLQKT